MPTDYTKHPEGIYCAEVLRHEIGEKNGDDYLIIHLALNYKEPEGDVSFAGERVRSEIRFEADKIWKVEKWLKALGYKGRGLRDLYADNGTMFSGQEIKVGCTHSVSKKTGNKNEFWDLPSGKLNKLADDKLALWDEMLTKAQGQPEETSLVGDDLPF